VSADDVVHLGQGAVVKIRDERDAPLLDVIRHEDDFHELVIRCDPKYILTIVPRTSNSIQVRLEKARR
jgi:hypothetical protein